MMRAPWIVLLVLSGSVGLAQGAKPGDNVWPKIAAPAEFWAPPGGPLIEMDAQKAAIKEELAPSVAPASTPPPSGEADAPLFAPVSGRIIDAQEPTPAAVPEPTSAPALPRVLSEAMQASTPPQPPAAPQPATIATPTGIPKPREEAPTAQPKTPREATRLVLSEPIPGMRHLPGMEKLPPPVNAPHPLVMDITSGITEVVTVSSTQPNRIATPFQKPVAVDSSGAEIAYVANNVYVLPASTDPFGIFISDETGGPVAALTLIPKPIPAQNIILQIDRSRMANEGGAPEEERAVDPAKHTERLVTIMRSAVLDRIPPGFTVTKLDVGRARVGPVALTPDKRWTGGDLDIYRYRVDNLSSGSVELTESSFYEEGVKAVSFYPSIRLAPRQKTYVFVARGGRLDAGRGRAIAPLGAARRAP